jgi:hypothetical protein
VIGLAIQRVQEETFRFTPNNGEPEIIIRSGLLRQWLLDHAMDKVTDLTFPADETLDSIIARHGLEPSRMASMTKREAKEPVIVALWPGGTHVLVDGGHRRWFWAARGRHTIKGWAVPEAVWRAFILDESSVFVTRVDPTGDSLPHRVRS